MTSKISRRKLAEYVADQAQNGTVPARVLAELAAYLQETHRVREIPLVVRTIEDVLAERGQVVARVMTARGVEPGLLEQIKTQLGATDLYVEESVEPSLLGGVKVQTPGRSLDASLSSRINSIRKAKLA